MATPSLPDPVNLENLPESALMPAAETLTEKIQTAQTDHLAQMEKSIQELAGVEDEIPPDILKAAAIEIIDEKVRDILQTDA